MWDFKACSGLSYGTSHKVPGGIHLLSCARIMLSSRSESFKNSKNYSYAIIRHHKNIPSLESIKRNLLTKLGNIT